MTGALAPSAAYADAIALLACVDLPEDVAATLGAELDEIERSDEMARLEREMAAEGEGL